MAPFEGKYSKHRANLKRRREKRHAGGESDLDGHASLEKRERERARRSFPSSFSQGGNTQLPSPFLRGSNETMGYFQEPLKPKVEMHQGKAGTQGRG